MTVGLVCPKCDALTDMGASRCMMCGAQVGPLTASPANSPLPSRAAAAPAPAPAKVMNMSICPSCGNQVPPSDRFCGKCGTRTSAPEPTSNPALTGKTMFFAGVQMPGRAKLVVVKSDSADGVAYQLN